MSPEEAAEMLNERVANRVTVTRRQVDSRMGRCANALKTSALDVLDNPSPSAPGNPPGVRSGDLRKNWTMFKTGGGGSGSFGIQSGMGYSGYLENGTRKMEARPYVEKIKEEAMPEIKTIISEIGG